MHTQFQEAVDYCLQNDCKEYKALISGLFPLIRHVKKIKRRLELEMNKRIKEQKHLLIVTVNGKKMNGKEVLSTPLVAESPVGVEDTSEEHMLKLESY